MQSRRYFAFFVTVALVAISGGAANAYQQTGTITQAETRDTNGRFITEASIIHTIVCNAPNENQGQFYIYQYLHRAGFRAIQPPNWGSAIGGQDFSSFEAAASTACTRR
jgi:hypothetical protein